MSALYSTKVTAVGGRNGTVLSDDGLLNLQLALPSGLGAKAVQPIPSNCSRLVTRPASAMPSSTAHATKRRKSGITTLRLSPQWALPRMVVAASA